MRQERFTEQAQEALATSQELVRKSSIAVIVFSYSICHQMGGIIVESAKEGVS